MASATTSVSSRPLNDVLALTESAQNLLKTVNGWAWSTIQSTNLQECGIEYQKLCDMHSELTKLFVDFKLGERPPEILLLLNKIEKNIDFGKRVFNFFSPGGRAELGIIDPRVVSIYGKIFKQDACLTENKLQKYSERMSFFNTCKINTNTDAYVQKVNNRLIELRFPPNASSPSEKTSPKEEQITPTKSVPQLAAFEKFAGPVIPLQEVINRLALKNEAGFNRTVTEAEFNRAVEILTSLQKQSPFNFPMINSGPQHIFDRIRFQLYCIQAKENPGKIDQNDPEWGAHAFQDRTKSTDSERLRAVQRVQAECLMFLIEQELKDPDGAYLPKLLELLEGLKLDPKDLPNEAYGMGMGNLAYFLFVKLYENYLTAYIKHRTTICPSDKRFFGDGDPSLKRALIGPDRGEFPLFIKQNALQNVVNSLKQEWFPSA